MSAPDRSLAVRTFALQALGIAARLAVPIILVAAFFAVDHSHQRNDEAFYLQQAQDSYYLIRHHGLFSGAIQTYLSRNWRPILHPFLAVPFFFLSGGRADPAVVYFIVTCYAFFLFSVFRLLREYLRDPELTIATWFIGLLPTVLFRTATFNSELSLLAGFAAFLYHLKKCDFFTSRRHSIYAGIFLGLSICLRPTEALGTAFLLGIPYLLIARHNGKLRWIDLGYLILVSAAVSIPLLLELRFPQHLAREELAYLPVAFIPCLLFFVPARWKPRSSYWFFVTSAIGISVIWYAPVMHGLYNWAFSSTFSAWAVTTGSRTGVSKIEFFKSVAVFFAWPLLTAIFCISLLNARETIRDLRKALILLPAVVLPVIAGSFTFNADPRYYLLGVLLISLAAVVLALQSAAGTRWARVGLCGAVVLVMVCYRASVLSRSFQQEGRIQSWILGPYPENPSPHDMIEDLYADWSGKLSDSSQSRDGSEICILQMRQFNELDWIADPWALTVMSHERGKPWTFVRPWPGVSDTAAGRFDFVKKECDYVVVLPVEHQYAPDQHFMSDVGEVVLTSWKKHTLRRDRLSFFSSGTFRGSDGHTAHYLIFQSLRKPMRKNG